MYQQLMNAVEQGTQQPQLDVSLSISKCEGLGRRNEKAQQYYFKGRDNHSQSAELIQRVGVAMETTAANDDNVAPFLVEGGIIWSCI